jgi:hypothetical protein
MEEENNSLPKKINSSFRGMHMKNKGTPLDPAKQSLILKKLTEDAANRRNSYRERALRLFPHICARCGREFSGNRLSQLTVHHKDLNYKNNPPDGSNWELLCIYCHDNEHEVRTESYFAGGRAGDEPAAPVFSPFAGLDELINLSEGDLSPEEKTTDKGEK